MEENNMKTVAVVGTVGVPACYGGFESLVQNQLIINLMVYNIRYFALQKNIIKN